jgi:dihydrofolate reductase
MKERKVVLYISMSLDGYIATENDEIDWLSIVEQEGEDYGYGAMSARVDTYIIGRKTYEVVKGLLNGEFPQAKQYDCYVLTRQNIESEDDITFYNGDIKTLIEDLKSKPGKDIYCDGGGEVVKLLMSEHLIDEYIISIMPIMLGGGKRLFKGSGVRESLKALSVKQFESGLIQVHYEQVKDL